MNMNSKPKYILGLSFFYHDSAAALLKDGHLMAAAQEERFTRKKHDEAFPLNAINYCLAEAGIAVADIDCVVFYDKPILKFERILVSFVKYWPFGFKTFLKAISSWLKEKLWVKKIIHRKLGYSRPIYFAEHHMSHMASSFFASPFKEAAILTVDGVGEWTTTSYAYGSQNKIEVKKEIIYPDSLGLFYSIFTHYLGFKPNSAEYKVMGLAPYGVPRYSGVLRKLIKIFDDGSFELNGEVFKSYYEIAGFEAKLGKLLGFPRRQPAEKLEQIHKDLAASLQEITNEIMVKLANYIHQETGADNLCLAGGVALNCVANSEILKKSGFKNIFIQPAAGDAGGALGAASYVWHHVFNQPRSFEMRHCFWGPAFNNDQIKKFLDSKSIECSFYPEDELIIKTARLISHQKVIGWFQGRMEWGPRSLGARSILADPRNKENWQRVNLKIKFRESFRPFAPSVIEEDCQEYFDFTGKSPYMLFIADVRKDNIPAVTHVDKTARIQTVDSSTNPLFYKLLQFFKKLTGCPVLINTSFNIRGEPIVCTPEDAFNNFIKTEMDYLVIGNYILDKKDVIGKYPLIKPEIPAYAD